MLKLRIVYLHGLNERVSDTFKNGKTHKLVGKCFPPLKGRHHRMARGQLHKDNPYLAQTIFSINLTSSLLMICQILISHAEHKYFH